MRVKEVGWARIKVLNLTVKINGEEKYIPFKPGETLIEILENNGIYIHTGCMREGTCGMCKVLIEKGDAGEPCQKEKECLNNAQLSKGIRLACLLKPENNLTVRIIAALSDSSWKKVQREENLYFSFFNPFSRENGFDIDKFTIGAAIDVGTTHICISLYDLSNCKWLAGCYGINPQINFGTDVMTRLNTAAKSKAKAAIMKNKVIDAVGDALRYILATSQLSLKDVGKIAVTGNTVMMVLLSGRGCESLNETENWTEYIDCVPETNEDYIESWKINHDIDISFIPPLAGFVGSDLICGVENTELIKNREPGLMIDFGTNTEIVLWDGKKLWCTSVAGGPAFEGSGISCGMPAEPGAIYKAALVNGKISFKVIAGREPLGICGTGITDTIVCMLKQGCLLNTGIFKQGYGDKITISDVYYEISVTKKDISIFQTAKAAVASGIEILLKKAGFTVSDLKRVCLAGAMGCYLNVDNAAKIGLLPEFELSKVEHFGNTALAGCRDVLLSPKAASEIESIRNDLEIINLSKCSEFNELYMDNLYFKPMN